MAEAFRGEFYQKVDGKARVSIPAAFRRILEADDPATSDSQRPRLYMVYGGKKRTFVECYSRIGADKLAADVNSMDDGSDERIKAELNLITRSAMVEIEPDGRIVLPPKVREKIGLAGEIAEKTEVAFAGLSNRFRLYRRDVYDAEFADDEDDDDVDPLTLVGRHKRKD
ncbi:MAG: division/cell wall cluster transcriptional repressor MraZ [Paracoccaceae bacterium]